MKLAWATDTHLDCASPYRTAAFFQSLKDANPDGLVLTGDIANAGQIEGALTTIAKEVLPTKPIYYVLGNHDYYHGSIEEVRTAADAGWHTMGWYLSTCKEPFELTPTTALIGHDGWYDARHGDHRNSNVIMNDWHVIRDLHGLRPKELRAKVRELATEAAEHVLEQGREALGRFQNLVVATHVPPFRGAATYQGKPSDDDWAPWFTSKAMGDALMTLAKEYPKKQIRVLCGHSHGGSDIHPHPNLRVTTGAAEYGEPQLQEIISCA